MDHHPRERARKKLLIKHQMSDESLEDAIIQMIVDKTDFKSDLISLLIDNGITQSLELENQVDKLVLRRASYDPKSAELRDEI